MKKSLISLLIIISLGLALIFSSIASTDFEKLYQEFLKNTRADVDSISSSNFTVNKYPLPYLVIDEINQDGVINLKNVEIHFSLMSLLTFSPQIKTITIGEAKLYLNNDNINLANHDDLISELITKGGLSIEANINKLSFVESDNDVPLQINNFSFKESENQTKFSGDLDGLGVVEGDFTKTENDIKLRLELRDDSYSINLMETYKESKLQEGEGKITTNNLGSKIETISPEISRLMNIFKSSEEVVIAFDITPNENALGLKNINISSDSIEGNGEIHLSKTPSYQNNIKLSFNKINLVTWRESPENTQHKTSAKYISNSRFEFDKNKLQADVFFKDIKLDDDNSLSNISTKFAIKDGNLSVEEFEGTIDKVGSFKVTGDITQNAFRNLFKGKIYLNHNDLNDLAEMVGGKSIRTDEKIPFILTSDLKLSSVDISLQNLLVKTDVADISGDLSTKFIGTSIRTNSNLRFTAIDTDRGNLPGVKKAMLYIESLFEGMKEENYLSKFIPIRQITSIGNHMITLDSLKIGQKIFDNVIFSLNFSPGEVAIEQLYIQDGQDWIDTSIKLAAQTIKPTLSVIIHNGSVGWDFLSPSGLLKLRNKLLNKYDLSKIDVFMSCALKKIYEKDFEIGRVRLSAKNKNNLIDIQKLDFDLLGGRMGSSGSALLDPYTINFVYSLNSAKIKQIAQTMPENYLQSEGVLSASGMWSTNGSTLEEQLYNLYTNSNIVAKGLTFNDFSIDDLVQNLNPINYNIVNVSTDVKNALLTGKTNVDDFKTSVEISKGVLKLPNIMLKTKSSSASASASIDLYKFNIDANAIFSFYLAKIKYGQRLGNYTPTNMGVSVIGSILSPKKEADTEELQLFLKKRVIK